jgi:CrcB protein
MDRFFLVFVGGGLGAVARYAVGLGVGRLNLTSLGINVPNLGRVSLPSWPYATFAVNVVGGFLMGVLAGLLALRVSEGGENWRLAFGVGLLGGFTTFSAFSLETALLLQRRDIIAASAYIVLSVVLSVMAVFAGLLLTRKIFG